MERFLVEDFAETSKQIAIEGISFMFSLSKFSWILEAKMTVFEKKYYDYKLLFCILCKYLYDFMIKKLLTKYLTLAFVVSFILWKMYY